MPRIDFSGSMLPTIDISLIGIILAVWNVVKVIWDYTSKAFNWIMQRALALFIGSKFWATAAFLVAAGVLIHAASSVISAIVDRLLTLVLSSASVPEDIVRTSGFFIDGDNVTDCISYCLSCWGVFYVCVSLDFSRRAFQRVYSILSGGWKT